MLFRSNLVSPMFNKVKSNEWRETQSSFGGLAIYKSQILLDARYSTSGGYTCEHVGFHDYLVRNGAKIYINGNFINSSWTPNSLRSLMNFLGFLLFGKCFFKIRNTLVQKQ